MADGRDLLLGPGGLAGFTVHLEAEPNPGTRRLMDWLGVEIEVRPVSDAPVDHVRRPNRRGRTMGHYDAGYELPTVAAGKPDWIDYRASVGRAERRLEAGELVSRCWSCKTELDVQVPVHSPRCRRNGTDGREALDAMDGLVSQAELLEEHQADDEPESQEEVETVTKPQWTRESILAAIREWARNHHGQPPTGTEWKQGGDHPSTSTVKRKFGTWANGIVAAGFERPTRGGNKGSSVREPKAREAAVRSGPPPAEAQGGATPPQPFVSESPGPVVGMEAGSRTDEHLLRDQRLEMHGDWYANLPSEFSQIPDEIARLDELATLTLRQRDALQAFLDALEAE